ncbi:MAG TPA: hypothetical protein VIY51_12365 [Xanthobacteraceae bacterium]
MAAHPLAYCPTCKIVFPIAPPAGGTVVFKNSTTSCPNGHFARILNPAHQKFEAELQAALGVHHQPVRNPILALWEKLGRREIAAEQAQAEAERIKPGLGSIFSPASFSDPIKKAILEALIADLAAESGPNEAPQVAQQDIIASSAAPEAEAPQEPPQKLKGGNRAFQRRLRHQHRMLMNPRSR